MAMPASPDSPNALANNGGAGPQWSTVVHSARPRTTGISSDKIESSEARQGWPQVAMIRPYVTAMVLFSENSGFRLLHGTLGYYQQWWSEFLPWRTVNKTVTIALFALTVKWLASKDAKFLASMKERQILASLFPKRQNLASLYAKYCRCSTKYANIWRLSTPTYGFLRTRTPIFGVLSWTPVICTLNPYALRCA